MSSFEIGEIVRIKKDHPRHPKGIIGKVTDIDYDASLWVEFDRYDPAWLWVEFDRYDPAWFTYDEVESIMKINLKKVINV